MAVYQSPGVYVEEVPSAVKPIAGVGTSTAVFIGVVEYAEVDPTEDALMGRTLREKIGTYNGDTPVTKDNVDDIVNAANGKGKVKVKPLTETNHARLCTNFSQFTKLFGSFAADKKEQGWLVHAVYGFFNNGGTRCWVTRVTKLDKSNVKGALEGLEVVDEIALVAVPGATTKEVQEAILDHCKDEHLQDRFAVLDSLPNPDSPTKDAVQVGVRNSSYGAIYFPWIDVGEKDQNKNPVYMPPSGHVAGVYARVDTERGVHKAPANEVIRGALGVQTLVSKEQQVGLNPEGINVIRKFNGNITVWGARTWADPGKEPEWKYINVRRLFLYLRKSIEQGTQWVVFEPNDPALWAKITRNVTAFLTNVWRDGALFGATPQEAFYVKCDEETNPPEVRDQGQVVTEIGVAVTKPAEFVIFRISQWAVPGEA